MTLAPGALLHQINQHWRKGKTALEDPLDPQFGKTDIGGSSRDTFINHVKVGCRFQAPATGVINTLSVYFGCLGTRTFRAVVYADVAGAPGARLDFGILAPMANANSWQTPPGINCPITGGLFYWLTIQTLLVAGGNRVTWFYDAGAVNQTAQRFDAGDPDDPFGPPTLWFPHETSIYADYTPVVTAGGGSNLIPAAKLILDL